MNIIVLLREQSLTYEQSITYSPLSEIFQTLGSDELCPHLKIQTLSSFLSWQLRQCKFVELLQRGQVTQFCWIHQNIPKNQIEQVLKQSLCIKKTKPNNFTVIWQLDSFSLDKTISYYYSQSIIYTYWVWSKKLGPALDLIENKGMAKRGVSPHR